MKNNNDYNYFLHYQRFHDMNPATLLKNIQSFKDLLKNIIPQDKNSKILDIGCATGEALLALKELGYDNVQGIDIDNNLINIAKAHKVSVEYVDDTEVYLEQFHQQFDTILLLDVLEHIAVPRQIPILKSIHRALSPNGKLILMIPNACCPVASIMRYGDFTHICSFTPYSINFILLNAGFEKIKITDLTPAPTVKISLRFWRSYARRHYKELIVRKIWKTMLEVFVPFLDKNTPISVNILVETTKNCPF